MINQHQEGYPIIVIYKKSIERDYPLILIIGREPNNFQNFIGKVGDYDFDLSPRCAFWNMAYKIIGKEVNLSAKDLKKLSREKSSSIICFSDCLPKPIPNKEKSKDTIRREIKEEDIVNHITNIFNKDILKRVNLIIISGVDKKPFEKSVSLIKEECYKLNILLIEIPFLAPNNSSKINIDKNSSLLIKENFRIFGEV
ncbi:MAG: hypothetical protein AABX28_03020 [Nanoarchaeota archaeon]